MVLLEHDVDFVLVGALSAVLQGAPLMTLDVDVVHARTAMNIEKTLAALNDLDAHSRGHPGKKLRPTAEHLAGAGHHLLITKYGPLDLLGAIENDLDYEALLSDTIQLELGSETVSVLTLSKYVALKEESAFAKDLARLPTLRETLALRNSGDENE